MKTEQRKSHAHRVKYSMVFSPPEWVEGETIEAEYELAVREYREARDWLEQFYPCREQCLNTGRKHLLIVGTETYVEQVWSMRTNNYRGVCYLEWQLPPDQENNDES